MSDVVIFTEQRCWANDNGPLTGRKSLTALAELSRRTVCHVVARAGHTGDGHQPMVPQEHGHSLVRWPSGRLDLPSAAAAATTMWRLVGTHRATVVYAPGVVGALAGTCALLRRRPLLVVAVGDPAESLSPTVMPGARGRVARALLSGSMRILCRRAAIVRYVTATILQTRYPPGAESTVIAGSDIGELHPQAVANPADDGHVVVVTVASLDQPYKGVQELIDAVARIRGQGWNVTLRVAGTGRLLHTLRTHGRDALGDAVEFTGHLDPPDLDRFLQAAHVFVLPSWTEGLPRALVEAMGNGLPCIASDVGGNRELLTSKHLFAPRSTNELTLALSELLHDREGWEAMGRRNVERAAEVARGGELANRDFARAAAQMVGSRR